jgi:tetratricopeptide (TPR) repeat protein
LHSSRAALLPQDIAAPDVAAPSLAARLAEAVTGHRSGRLGDAERGYRAVLQRAPDHPDALHLLGLLVYQRGDAAAALALLDRALDRRPDFALALSNRGTMLRAVGRVAEATDAFRRAMALRPDLAAAALGLAGLLEDAGDLAAAVATLEGAVARDPALAVGWLDLGRARRKQRRFDAAIAALERAVALTPDMFAAHNELGIAHHETGAWDDAVTAYRRALACPGDTRPAWRNLGHALKRLGRTAEAVDCYRRAARHRWPDAAERADGATTSATKLAHDIAQLRHLEATGWRAPTADLVARYETVLAAVRRRAAPSETVVLDAAEQALLEPGYNRLLHVAEAPALDGGPFGAWDADAVATAYAAARPQLVVIDDFLSAAALASLRRYCLESTVWFDCSHAGGYLAAFLDDGFDCPLVVQIADALRAALPRVLGPHSLRHLWAYKYDSTLAGIGVHGDDAAVNVNFWITPDDANLDASSGGMIVYPVAAPATWRFADFNADDRRVDDYVAAHAGAPRRIAYRQNRAVLFDSSLFHATDRFRFAPDYPARRINVTLLYGDR